MNFDLDKCVVGENISIRESLRKLNENCYGFIFTCNADEEITGLATD